MCVFMSNILLPPFLYHIFSNIQSFILFLFPFNVININPLQTSQIILSVLFSILEALRLIFHAFYDIIYYIHMKDTEGALLWMTV